MAGRVRRPSSKLIFILERKTMRVSNARLLSTAAAVTSLSLAISLAGAGVASAATIYTYTGNLYGSVTNPNPPSGTYTTAMSISGSFELATALAPNLTEVDISASVVSYSFFDGRNTLTDANSAHNTGFWVTTDALGDITGWHLNVLTSDPVSIGEQQFQINTRHNTFAASSLDLGRTLQCVSLSGSNCLSNADSGQLLDSAGVWSGVVPEPSTALLVSLGLSGLSIVRRRG